MSKLLTVFGATGLQGGSVINYVLQHPELSKTYRLRGITRDVSKPAAVALREKGVEVVKVGTSRFYVIKSSSTRCQKDLVLLFRLQEIDRSYLLTFCGLGGYGRSKLTHSCSEGLLCSVRSNKL